MDSGVVIFAGLRGSGKTHRIREYVTRLAARGRRIYAFDVSGDIYKGLAEHYARRKDGAAAFVARLPSVEDWIQRRDKPKLTDKALPPIVCIVPDKPRTFRAQGALFKREMLDRAKSGDVWVSDEAELVFTEFGASSDVFPLVTLSRNFGTLLIVACKDPVRVSVDIRRGADSALIFALKTRESCLAMRDIVDADFSLRATTLKKRQFLYVPPVTEESTRSSAQLLGPDDDLPDEL